MRVFRSLCIAPFLSNCNQNQNVSTKLVKILNMIFLEYLSSSIVPCGKIDQLTDMAGLFTVCLQMLLRCAFQLVIYQMSEDKEYVITTCAKMKCLHSNHLLPMLTLVTWLLTEPQSFHTPQSSLLFPWLPPREPCPLKQQHIIFFLNKAHYSVLCHRKFTEKNTWYICFT